MKGSTKQKCFQVQLQGENNEQAQEKQAVAAMKTTSPVML